MAKRVRVVHDTAKDIITGANPLGYYQETDQTHRKLSDGQRIELGRRSLGSLKQSSLEGNEAMFPEANTAFVDSNLSRRFMQLLNEVQNQMESLRRRQQEIMTANEIARKQLQSSQDLLAKRVENGILLNPQMYTEVRSQMMRFEEQMRRFAHDIELTKTNITRQMNEYISASNEMKNRSAADISKLTQSNQFLENRVRDLLTQISDIKNAVEVEVSERTRNSQSQLENINKLREYVREQETNRNEMLLNMIKRNDEERERLNEEIRNIGDKMQQTSQEMAKSVVDRENRLKEEISRKHKALEMEFKTKFDAKLDSEKNTHRKNEERWQAQAKFIEELRTIYHDDKSRYKERFLKVNEALIALERHLELGNQKIDKLMGAEIESRKLHEKNLLGKIADVETKLNGYLDNLAKTINDVKTGISNIKIPTLDMDALRRDMEAIASDKSKLSMEGLLKLEERISRIQHIVSRDRRELQSRLVATIDKELDKKLKTQVEKLDDLMDDIERAQVSIRDKVERQIPLNLEELTAKVDNLRMQLTNRIDQEEEERYLAINELQNVYGELAAGNWSIDNKGIPNPGVDGITGPVTLKRDVEECKIAIKKLAESVTTVKNVLDRKIIDEIRRREKDIDILNSRIDTITVQALQQIH